MRKEAVTAQTAEISRILPAGNEKNNNNKISHYSRSSAPFLNPGRFEYKAVVLRHGLTPLP